MSPKQEIRNISMLSIYGHTTLIYFNYFVCINYITEHHRCEITLRSTPNGHITMKITHIPPSWASCPYMVVTL